MMKYKALALLSFALSAAAVESTNHARGFDPGKVYQLGDLDHINVFNGNLIVSLPIGPRYPVNGNLSYQLSLVYNGNSWNYRERALGAQHEALPNRFTNAGLGWQLTLGELISPNDPLIADYGEDPNAGWVYAAPDGAQRVFRKVLHPQELNTSYAAADAPAPDGVVGYTRDGSYLRLKRLPPELMDQYENELGSAIYVWRAHYQIEFSDGTAHQFASEEYEKNQPGVPAYSLEKGLRFFLTRMEDRFGNFISISHSEDADLNPIWTITDSAVPGRTTTVTFESSAYYEYLNGPQNRFLVKSVVFPVFNGTTATYTFDYSDFTQISKPCSDTWVPDPDAPAPPTKKVRFLDSITLPDQSSFSMSYLEELRDTSGNIICRHGAGHLTSLSVPTGGRFEYEVGLREFPRYVSNAPTPQDPAEPFTRSAAVQKRTVVNPNGTGAVWQYRSIPGVYRKQPENYDLYPAMAVLVMDPEDDTTVHYFNTDIYALSCFIGGGNSTQYGMPFTRGPDTAAGDGLLLSTQTFDGLCSIANSFWAQTANECPTVLVCKDSSNTALSAVRQTFVEYESDGVVTGERSPGNQRLRASRTEFLDDVGCGGTCFTKTAFSDFDGLGHYRTETRSSNFPGSSTRTSFTGYNANSNAGNYPDPNPANYMIGPAEVWLTGVFDRTSVTEDETNEEELCFERSTGFLLRKRTLAAAAAGRSDLLAVFEKTDGKGNVTAEEYFGSDSTPLPNGFTDTCADNPGAHTYRIDHTYSHGVRATSQYDETTFKTLDLTIDSNTGLASASRDSAGLQTTYTYDAMGRLLDVVPPDGEAWTEHRYDLATQPASVSISRKTSDETLTESRIYYDGVGRAILTKDRMPDAGATQQWTTSRTLYDASGRKQAVTVPFYSSNGAWEPPGAAQPSTSFVYDRFGRTTTITAPDLTATTMAYTGDRQMLRTVTVATPAGEVPAQTRETYDGLGRLIEVEESSGVDDPATPGDESRIRTTHLYDSASRLISARTTAGEVVQERLFTYDGRGLLISERHPEKGSGGNGQVTYGYDARGHVTRKIDGPFDLTFEYDSAERLRYVRDLGSRVLKEYTYATANDGNDYAQGKLRMATRHNHHPLFGDVAVAETYVYNGRGGRVGERDTTVSDASQLFDSAFSLSQTYDELGSIDAVVYPSTPSHTAARTVANTYSRGVLTAVNGYASITYQASGLVSAVTHAGGLTETWQSDLNGMSRPRRITVTGPNGFQWTHGDYAYDGAGNVKQIGSRHYRYDRVGRLVWDTDTTTGVPVTIAYAYDAFGNRTREGVWTVTGDAVARFGTVIIPLSSATNRLGGRAQYDEAGNLTRWAADLSSTSAAGDHHFTYDAAGMMLTQTSAGRETHYLYTADDERIAIIDRIGSANRTTWTLRGTGNQLLRTFIDDASSGTRTWSWKEDQIWRGAALLAAETPAATTHYGLDHLGSPRVVARTGQTPALQFFDAFGKGGTTDGGSLQFTAHERDRAFVAGEWQEPFDYMHARYYSPSIGRFLAVDPVRGDSHAPQSWNAYAYTRNNPLGRVDPDGRCEQYPGLPPCSDGTIMVTAEDPGFLASLPYRAFYAAFGSGAEKNMVRGDDERASQILIDEANGKPFVFAGTVVVGPLSVPRSIASISGTTAALPALSDDVAATFEGGQYTARVLQHDMIVYRVEGTGMGRWFGTQIPDSAASAERLYNITSFNPANTMTHVQAYTIPARTIIYEGVVAGGIGRQIFVANPWAAGVSQLGSAMRLSAYGY